MATGRFQKGIVPWNKDKKMPNFHPIGMRGKKFTTEQREKIKLNSSKKDKHWNWKGGIAEKTNYGTKDRISVMEILGFKCCRCDFTDLRALQIDHINSNGHEERRNRGTESYYRFILNKVLQGSKDYQILCANCNWIKRSENKEGKRITK